MNISGFRGALCNCVCVLALFVFGPASASTIFAPTDGDVNFINSNFTGLWQLAMFDDADTSFTGSSLLISVPEIVDFTAGGTGPGDYTATGTGGSLNLIGSDWFILAISKDNGLTWIGDTGANYLGANAYEITFGDGTVLTVDVSTVVPVPAAVWLMGSGLIGLIGIARRRKKTV